MAEQVWFITGCSTGFGRELAKLLLDQGRRVVVTARDKSKVEDLVQNQPNAMALTLDVTDAKQIHQAVKDAEAKFGRIDVLVNNAGYGYLAALEEGEESESRAMFETNVFGLIEMTRAVLPLMRKQRSGHVVNVSSIGGLVGFPGVGYYHGTKFAVEGISEALSKEVAPLGIKVLIVEPGPFRTDWAGRSLKKTNNPIEDYAETAGARRAQTAGYSGQQPGDPVRGAQAIITAVDSANPPLRLLLGKPALEFARKKLTEQLAEIDAWAETTLSADFPS